MSFYTAWVETDGNQVLILSGRKLIIVHPVNSAKDQMPSLDSDKEKVGLARLDFRAPREELGRWLDLEFTKT